MIFTERTPAMQDANLELFRSPHGTGARTVNPHPER
jgi:hypothetical protein